MNREIAIRDELILLKKDYIKLMVEYIATIIMGLVLFVTSYAVCFTRNVQGVMLFAVLFATILPSCWYSSYISFGLRNIRKINKAIKLITDVV